MYTYILSPSASSFLHHFLPPYTFVILYRLYLPSIHGLQLLNLYFLPLSAPIFTPHFSPSIYWFILPHFLMSSALHSSLELSYSESCVITSCYGMLFYQHTGESDHQYIRPLSKNGNSSNCHLYLFLGICLSTNPTPLNL